MHKTRNSLRTAAGIAVVVLALVAYSPGLSQAAAPPVKPPSPKPSRTAAPPVKPPSPKPSRFPTPVANPPSYDVEVGAGGQINPKSVIAYFREKAGRQPYSPVILAHRGLFGSFNTTPGANRAVPENSLAAIKAASDAGIEGVEIDVRASSDPNTPVIMHDSTVGRTTNIFDPWLGNNGALIPTPIIDEYLSAGEVTLPPGLSPEQQEPLRDYLTRKSAFSPYGELQSNPTTGFLEPKPGTAFGRNPRVRDLSPAALKALHLLKFMDPALRPALNPDGSQGTLATEDHVFSETVSTVQDVLAYAANQKLRTAIVFDVLEKESLPAIAKILANDTHTFVDGLRAKDVVVLKYRAPLSPNIESMMSELKAATVSSQYPSGFYPNVIGIVAKYMDNANFSSEAFTNSWISLRSQRSDFPLIALDIVQTSPTGSGTPLIKLANDAKVAIGSFNDIPSYRGGDIYTQEIVNQKLYILANGVCCRTPASTGDPTGTPDTRWDYNWLLPDGQSGHVPSGMITSDDPLPIIAKLKTLGLRDRATAAYRSDPVAVSSVVGIQITRIIVRNIDGENPGDVYGQIRVVRGARYSDTDLIWSVIGWLPQYPNADLVNFYGSPIYNGSEEFAVDFDIWDHDKDWSPNDSIAHGRLTIWPREIDDNQPRTVTMKGQYGSVEVEYRRVVNATQMELLSTTLVSTVANSNPKIFGTITAGSGSDFFPRSFNRSSSDPDRPAIGGNLSLVRRIYVAKQGLEFVFDVSLWDQYTAAPNKPVAVGKAFITPKSPFDSETRKSDITSNSAGVSGGKVTLTFSYSPLWFVT